MLLHEGRSGTGVSPTLAEGWHMERLTPPSRLFGANGLRTGPDGRIYAGTCNMLEKERLGAMLISLDPKSRKQEILADMEKLTGEETASTFPQSKIHSQICFDRRGLAWFGTHSYEWNSLEQYQKNPGAYTGGHLITYDIHTRESRDLGILVPHESIMSLALAKRPTGANSPSAPSIAFCSGG